MKAAKIFLLTGMFALAIILLTINFDNRRYKRSVESYRIPDVTLVDQNRQPIRLNEYLETDKPVILEFIYTACTTVCPVMMVKFSNLQRRLEPDTERALLVSISIDPENDTPEVLSSYRERYQAQPGWDFLTGSVEDIREVMAAFHTKPTDMATLDSPVLLRSAGSDRWIRLTGDIDSQTFWSEFQQLQLPSEAE